MPRNEDHGIPAEPFGYKIDVLEAWTYANAYRGKDEGPLVVWLIHNWDEAIDCMREVTMTCDYRRSTFLDIAKDSHWVFLYRRKLAELRCSKESQG